MRALIPKKRMGFASSGEDFRDEADACGRLLRPILDPIGESENLIFGYVNVPAAPRTEFRIPRVILTGPKSGGDTIKLGLFATFHGDDPEGGEALVQFIQELTSAAECARGFHLNFYPVCNPSGFSIGTRNNHVGIDLTREFWRGSSQNEVYYLEREIGVHGFHGVVSLHTAKNSTQFLATCGSPIMEKSLVEPALEATRRFNSSPTEVTFEKREEIPFFS